MRTSATILRMEPHPQSPGPPARGRSQPLVLLWRAVRLRCPACGGAQIFRGWFAMHDACPACGRRFHRDAGYFLGSIYFNYGVTAMLVVMMYFAMFFGDVLPNEQRLVLLSRVRDPVPDVVFSLCPGTVDGVRRMAGSVAE